MSLPTGVREWRDGGRWISTSSGSVFVRSAPGDGPSVLLLHGYPSSSFDYRMVVPQLAGRARVTMDFLGFGLSDKPRPHRYSLREQAELVQAVVAETTSNPVALIAHDMGTSVATELLARDLDGHLPFELQAAVLSNGSVILDRASLRPIQNVLHGPLARSSRGWRIAACSVVASPDCSVRTIRCPRRKQRRNGRYCPTTGVTASRTC